MRSIAETGKDGPLAARLYIAAVGSIASSRCSCCLCLRLRQRHTTRRSQNSRGYTKVLKHGFLQ